MTRKTTEIIFQFGIAALVIASIALFFSIYVLPVTAQDTAPTFTPGNTIQVEWTPNTEPDLAGYKVYFRDGQGTYPEVVREITTWNTQDDGNVYAKFDTVKLQGIEGQTIAYYAEMTAYDQSGNESTRSEPYLFYVEIPDTTAPSPVAWFRFVLVVDNQ